MESGVLAGYPTIDLKATVPLSSMFGYATSLRSNTQGRGNYTIQFGHYDRVPLAIQEEIIAKRIA